MTAVVAEVTDFPILGEPLPVELANTLYSHTSGVIDFLETPTLVSAWFDSAPAASGFVLPRRLTNAQGEAVRELRDAGHRVLSDVVANEREVTRANIATINRYAARVSSRPQLEWDEAAGPRSTAVYTGGRFDVFVARLAADCITFLAGPSRACVRRCAHPDCTMFFVQQHRTRRFCHVSCAHRARQARYYIASAQGRRGGSAHASVGGVS